MGTSEDAKSYNASPAGVKVAGRFGPANLDGGLSEDKIVGGRDELTRLPKMVHTKKLAILPGHSNWIEIGPSIGVT